jgi:Glycosyl transferase family, a/b domain
VQALGVAVDLGPQSVARCVKEAGVGFMFAPRYHPAMAAVRQIRKDLGVSVLAWLHAWLSLTRVRMAAKQGLGQCSAFREAVLQQHHPLKPSMAWSACRFGCLTGHKPCASMGHNPFRGLAVLEL